MELAKLHGHLQTNKKEHTIALAKWFHSRQLKLSGRQIAMQKLAVGYNNENATFVSFEISILRAKAGKPRTSTEEPILPAAGAVASRMLAETATGNCIRHECEAKYSRLG